MKLIIENFGTVEVPIRIGYIVTIKKGRYGSIYYWDYVKTLPKLLKVCPYQYGEGMYSFYVDEDDNRKAHVPKEWKIKHIFFNGGSIHHLSLIVVLVSRFKDTLSVSYMMNHSNGVWKEYNSPFEVINRDRKGLEEIKVERV